MLNLQNGLLMYNQLVLMGLLLLVLATGQAALLFGPMALLVPVLFYLTGTLLAHRFPLERAPRPLERNLQRVARLYCAVVSILFFASTIFLMRSILELLLGLLLAPLPLYFLLEIYRPRLEGAEKTKLAVVARPVLAPKRRSKAKRPTLAVESEEVSPEQYDRFGVKDLDRRQFLKLLGGGSVGMVALLLLNPQKASAAFFGSVPGPGTVALKDSTGTVINPKEKTPTDGYSIAEIDDSGASSYYGFLDKSGNWYIAKETNAGAYRYVKGSSGFSTNWTNRASLTYDYFDTIF